MDSTLIESELPHSSTANAVSAEMVFEICEAGTTGPAAAAWKEIEQRLDSVPLACSWIWTQTWIECYKHLVDCHIVIGRVGDVVGGICLLSAAQQPLAGPLRINTLSLGTAGEPNRDSVYVEYNAILTIPEHRRAFEVGLLQILESQPGWDELHIDGFSPTDLPCGVTSDSGFKFRTEESPFYDFNLARQAGSDALTQLSYTARKGIRKNLRSYGTLTTQWAETTSQATEILDDLIRLHQARWEAVGEPGVFASQPFLRFHRSLLERLRIGRDVGLFRLLADDQTVGCAHMFIDRNRVLYYQGGTIPLGGNLSPGVITDYMCIEECLRRGFDSYDFLGHTSQHKRKLSTSTAELVWAVRRRPSLKFAVMDAVRSLRAHWRRVLQRSPSPTAADSGQHK